MQPDHPVGSCLSMFSPCSILSDTYAVKVGEPAPKYGLHTKEIMTSVLGYSKAEVDAFLESNIIGTKWSHDYIPGGNAWVAEKEYESYIDSVTSETPAARL